MEGKNEQEGAELKDGTWESLATGCFMPLDKSAIPLCSFLDTYGDVSVFLHIWIFLSMMLSIHCLEGRCLGVLPSTVDTQPARNTAVPGNTAVHKARR